MTNNLYLTFLFILLGCSHTNKDLIKTDDPLQSYQYIFNRKGILKLIHGQNRIILYNNCLERIDIIENVANNLQYVFTSWKDDKIEISILYDEYKLDIYKQMFRNLKESKQSVGNFEIKYSFKSYSNKTLIATEPYIIDSIKADSVASYIQLFSNGQLMANVAIEELLFSSSKIILKQTNNDEAVYKEVHLINGLKNSHILNALFEEYKKYYCQKVFNSRAPIGHSMHR